MGIARSLALVGVLAGVGGVAVYGHFEGVPQSDIIYAVRGRNLSEVKLLLERDPELVHLKVYPQGYERASQHLEFERRHNRSPWEGTTLVHEAADNGDKDAIKLLDMLAAAGADLQVRRKRRTLLHDAAESGNVEVVTWLIDRGANVNAGNDCGNTALSSDGRRCTTPSTLTPETSATCCSREAPPSTRPVPMGGVRFMWPPSGRI